MAQANGSLRNRFAKRHYEAIATAIQEARRRASDGDNDNPIANVVDELCWLFRSDNARERPLKTQENLMQPNGEWSGSDD